MRTLVMMHSPAMARQLALELENLGEMAGALACVCRPG